MSEVKYLYFIADFPQNSKTQWVLEISGETGIQSPSLLLEIILKLSLQVCPVIIAVIMTAGDTELLPHRGS